MYEKLVSRHGATAALTFILAWTLAGCGTHTATAPAYTQALNEPPGEVILPEPSGGKLSRPLDFVAQPLGGCTVVLSWTVPDNPCDAILYLDGVVMSRQNSACACYVDLCGKTPGAHTYELRHAIGAAMGPVETRIVTIPEPVGDGRGNGREPRTERG